MQGIQALGVHSHGLLCYQNSLTELWLYNSSFSAFYPTVTVALLTCVPLEDCIQIDSRWTHRWVWLFNVQAPFSGRTDYFPELCPQSLLTWRLCWWKDKDVGGQGAEFTPQSCMGCLTHKPTTQLAVLRIAYWKPRSVRKRDGGEEMALVVF